MQTLPKNVGRFQGKLDRLGWVGGVARSTGQIGSGAQPVSPLAMKLDQSTQGELVGGIGRHGFLQGLLGRHRIAQILLVPARHGHQQVSALGWWGELRQSLLAFRQQVRPAIVNRGHTRQVRRQVESRGAFLESGQHDHECTVGIPQIGLVDLRGSQKAAAALSRIQDLC